MVEQVRAGSCWNGGRILLERQADPAGIMGAASSCAAGSTHQPFQQDRCSESID
jgi:hypothetical protein